MDVEAAADELYGMLPDQFMARRTELSAAAKAEGDSAARTAITAMRRPAVAAWAVNLLVRTDPEGVQALLAIAEQLRAAQRELDGDQLREISAQRRDAIASLTAATRTACADAGRPVNDTVLREVQATLSAAVADENAETALRSGRLTAPLHYSGFGEVDISEAVAASAARPRLSVVRSDKPRTSTEPAGPEKAETGRTKHGSERALQARESELEQATATLDEVTERRDLLLTEAEQLRRRLNDIERDLRPTEAEVRSAQRRLETAERAVAQATERLGRHKS